MKRLELLQLLRHFILSEACLPFQHTCYCIYYCIIFLLQKKGIRKFDIKRSWRNRDLNSDSCDANTVYYQLYYFPFISYNIIFKHKEKYATLLDFYPDTWIYYFLLEKAFFHGFSYFFGGVSLSFFLYFYYKNRKKRTNPPEKTILFLVSFGISFRIFLRKYEKK